MKKCIFFIVLALFALLLGAFQKASSQSPEEGRRSGQSKFKSVDYRDLNPVITLAIETFNVAKLGDLKTFPYAKAGPQAKIDLANKTNYYDFIQRRVAVSDYKKGPDDVHTLTTVVESRDSLGRIDLSKNTIAFKTRRPDQEEAAKIKGFILSNFKTIKERNDKLTSDFQKAIADFHRAAGLKSDNIMGEETAEVLSRKMPFLDVQELASRVLYSPKPRHIYFILPLVKVIMKRSALTQGFKSLKAVRKEAIPAEEFKAKALKGKKFVLFVFFLDRVNPSSPIEIGFSSSPETRSKTMTPKQYALPGKWPVLVEPFSTNKEKVSEGLYLNLFINGMPLANHSLI